MTNRGIIGFGRTLFCGDNYAMKREEKLVGLFPDLLMGLIICVVSIAQARITVNKASSYSVDYCGSPV